MTVTFHSVLREFEIPVDPSPGNETFVFDSYTYTEEFGLSRFWREITNTRAPWEDTVIRMDDGTIIGSGEDPRAFVWKGSPCVHVTTWVPGHGRPQRVYVHKLRKWIMLIPPEDLASGKNWSPYVVDDELYFVHAIAPFRVLKARFINENDDYMVLDMVAEHKFRAPKSFDKFSIYRGGSNALRIGGRIFGLGHTNVKMVRKEDASMIHRPFVFDYTPEREVSLYELDFGFPDDYRIVDPTALYERDGSLFMVTCETERVWQLNPQKGRICLYTLNLKGKEHEEGFGIGRRRLHRWSHSEPSKIRRLLGAGR